MVVNRLQKDLINSCIDSPKGFNGKLSIFFSFFKCEYIFMFSNSDRDFYSENNSVSQVYTYNKNTKKS
jgi:hypothetical protein